MNTFWYRRWSKYLRESLIFIFMVIFICLLIQAMPQPTDLHNLQTKRWLNDITSISDILRVKIALTKFVSEQDSAFDYTVVDYSSQSMLDKREG